MYANWDFNFDFQVLSGLGSLLSTVTAVVAHAALHLVDLYNNSFLPF